MAAVNGNLVGRTCRGFQKLATDTAVSCPSPTGKVAMFQPEAQSLRYRCDGTAPTTTVGFLVAVGDTVFYEGDLAKLMFIGTAGSGTVNVSVFE